MGRETYTASSGSRAEKLHQGPRIGLAAEAPVAGTLKSCMVRSQYSMWVGHMQGGVNIHELFGLSQEEELMESFEAELRQTYSCNHNTHSKPQEVS